jgi:tetratricopeptide (TPR) repeat protein
MAAVTLTSPEACASFLQRCIVTNLRFWQLYVDQHEADIQALDYEWEGVIKAILLGLELKSAWPEAYQLILSYADFMERHGYWDVWQTLLSQALLLAQESHDEPGEVTLLALSARLGKRRGQIKQMVSDYRRTMRLARRVGDQFNEGRACTNLGYYYVEHGYWTRAEILCCYALHLFEQIDSNHGRAHTENHLGLLYIRQCRWEEAQQHLEKACAIWQISDDPFGLMYGFMNLGLMYLEMGQLEPALGYTDKALVQAKRAGEEAEVGRLYMNLSETYRKLGEMAAAEAYARQAIEIFHKHANSLDLGIAWKVMGEACLYQGKLVEAQFYLNTALETVRQHHNLYREIEVLLYLVETDFLSDNRPQAVARLAQVERLMENEPGLSRSGSLHPLLLKCQQLLAG